MAGFHVIATRDLETDLGLSDRIAATEQQQVTERQKSEGYPCHPWNSILAMTLPANPEMSKLLARGDTWQLAANGCEVPTKAFSAS